MKSEPHHLPGVSLYAQSCRRYLELQNEEFGVQFLYSDNQITKINQMSKHNVWQLYGQNVRTQNC